MVGGLLLSSLHAQDDYPTAQHLADEANRLAAEFGSLLGKDWIVSANNNVITFRSTFDIYRVGMISRATPPPRLDASLGSVRKEAVAEKYTVKLRFEKPLSKEEFLKRRNLRQKSADVITLGAKSKFAWADAAKAYKDQKVPRYRLGFYDIYRDMSESPGSQIFPLSALKKIGSVKEVLDARLGRVHHGNG